MSIFLEEMDDRTRSERGKEPSSQTNRKRQAIHLMHRKFDQAKSTGLDAPNTRASGRTAETNRHVKVQQRETRGPNKGPDDVLLMSGRTISQVGCTGP